MGTIQETSTNQLFNLTDVLTHAGDYAGKYQQEAFDLLMQGDDFMWTEDAWADIMHDNKGNCYAIIAKGELTSDSDCYFANISKEDCISAYNEAQTHLD